jgi:hypothetical protein
MNARAMADVQKLIDLQTRTLQLNGFDIGQRVRVDGKLNGVIRESVHQPGYVCIEFERADYLAVFPEKTESLYGRSHIMQFCPMHLLVKVE